MKNTKKNSAKEESAESDVQAQINVKSKKSVEQFLKDKSESFKKGWYNYEKV